MTMNSNKSLSIVDSKIFLNNCFVKISGVRCQYCEKIFKCMTDLDVHCETYHQPIQQTTRLVIKIGKEIISETDLKNKYLKRSLNGDDKENVDDPLKKRRRSDSSSSKNESNIIKTSLKTMTQICENIQEYLKLQENLMVGRSGDKTDSRDGCDIEINGHEIQHSTCVALPMDESTEDLLEIDEHKIIPILERSVISIPETPTNPSDDGLALDSSNKILESNKILDEASNQPNEINELVSEASDASHLSISHEKDTASNYTRLIHEEETEEIDIVNHDVTFVKERHNSVVPDDIGNSLDATNHVECNKLTAPDAEREKTGSEEDLSKEKVQNGEEELSIAEKPAEVEEPRDEKPSVEELRSLLSESNPISAEQENSFYAAGHVVLTITRDEENDFLVVDEDDKLPSFVPDSEVPRICEKSPEIEGERVKGSLDQSSVTKVTVREDLPPNSKEEATVRRKNTAPNASTTGGNKWSRDLDKLELERKREDRLKRVSANNTRCHVAEEDKPKSQDFLHKKAVLTKRRRTRPERKSLRCKNNKTELMTEQKQLQVNVSVLPQSAIDKMNVDDDTTANSASITAKPEVSVTLVQDKRPTSDNKSRNNQRRKTSRQTEKLSNRTGNNKTNSKQRKENKCHAKTSMEEAKCNDMKENVKLKGTNCSAKPNAVLVRDGSSGKVTNRKKRTPKSETANFKNKKSNKTELTIEQKLFFSNMAVLPPFAVDEKNVGSKNTISSNGTTKSEALVILVRDKSLTSGNRPKSTQRRKSSQHLQKFSGKIASIESCSEHRQGESISVDRYHDRTSTEDVKCNDMKENIKLKAKKSSSAQRERSDKVAGKRERNYSKRDYSKEKKMSATSPNYPEKKIIEEM